MLGIHYGGGGGWRQTSKEEEGRHIIPSKQANKYQLQIVLVQWGKGTGGCEKENQVENDLNYKSLGIML